MSLRKKIFLNDSYRELEGMGFRFSWEHTPYRINVKYHGEHIGDFNSCSAWGLPYEARKSMYKLLA